jgi:hypothetical protein
VNETTKTLSFVGGAALLCLLATLVGPRAIQHDLFSDEGQTFFANFTDPDAAVELDVVQFREGTGEIYQFNVKKDDKGRWTIPSHGGYPADAKTKMGKAAALMIGLVKERVVSDRKDDHPNYEVVDPSEENLELKGRGTRVTLKDKAGNALGDLIVGKAIEGKTDTRYVREPGKKRVYACKLAEVPSTKFADWIETDLLKAQSWDITKVTFDNYKVDEQRQEVVPGDKIVVKKDEASKWTLDGLDAQKEEPNEEKLREIGDTLGQIKIVGVRNKPQGLTAALEQANGFDRMVLVQALQSKGYFLGRGGKLFSNEGDLLFETRKGVRYTLRFGEIVFGEGDAVTSGKEDPKAAKPKEGEQGPPAPGAANNRYLMVSADFDESLLTKPSGIRLDEQALEMRKKAREQIEAIVRAIDAWKQKHENKLPESLAKLTEKPAEGEPLLKALEKDPWEQDYLLEQSGETFVVSSLGEDKKSAGEGPASDIRSDKLAAEDDWRRIADEWKAHETKITDGKKEAENLTKRFGPWYYVIDQSLFAKLKPTRKDLVKDKAKPADATAPAPGGTDPPKNGD